MSQMEIMKIETSYNFQQDLAWLPISFTSHYTKLATFLVSWICVLFVNGSRSSISYITFILSSSILHSQTFGNKRFLKKVIPLNFKLSSRSTIEYENILIS